MTVSSVPDVVSTKDKVLLENGVIQQFLKWKAKSMNELENEFTNLDFEEDVYDELPDFCYVQLQGWMAKLAHKYELALNELMIYAVIHSFSQDGVSAFRGSRDYLRLWAFCGRTSVFEKVKKLMDLKLIGREYVNYKGKEFPTYFTYASRIALKHTVTSSKKKAVQNLNLNTVLHDSEFKNRTESVQNLNSNSSEFGPNNNLNNNLKKAAAQNIQQPENKCGEESAAAAFLISKIKGNLGCNPYSEKFIGEMTERFKSEGFDDERVGEYLDFVSEKVKAKNPDSIHALFKKIVLADDVIADFVMKHSAKEKPKPLVCPVCGSENRRGSFNCCSCDFDLSYRFDADEIKKAKRIFALPSEQKKIRDMEIMQVLDEVPMTEIWNMENIKKRSLRLEEIDRRYGIID